MPGANVPTNQYKNINKSNHGRNTTRNTTGRAAKKPTAKAKATTAKASVGHRGKIVLPKSTTSGANKPSAAEIAKSLKKAAILEDLRSGLSRDGGRTSSHNSNIPFSFSARERSGSTANSYTDMEAIKHQNATDLAKLRKASALLSSGTGGGSNSGNDSYTDMEAARHRNATDLARSRRSGYHTKTQHNVDVETQKLLDDFSSSSYGEALKFYVASGVNITPAQAQQVFETYLAKTGRIDHGLTVNMAAAQGKDPISITGRQIGNGAGANAVAASSEDAMASLKDQAKRKTVGDTVSAAYMENGQVKVYTTSVNESGISPVLARNANAAEKAVLQGDTEFLTNAANEKGTSVVQRNDGKRPQHRLDVVGTEGTGDDNIYDLSKLNPEDVTREIAELLIANPANVFVTQHPDIVQALTGVDVSALFYAGGFVMDDDGIYHARQESSIQSFPLTGYNDFYDEVFNYATEMDHDEFEFTSDGKDYVIWVWKGDYLNLGAGAELAIYEKMGDTEHWLVDQDLAMPMTLTLDYNGETIISYDPKIVDPQISDPLSKSTDKWWVTGFNPEYQDKDPSELTATYTVTFNSPSMYDDFYKKYGGDPNGDDSNWTFDSKTMTGTLTF